MFIRGSPYKTTNISTVWALTTTVYTTGKQLSGPHVYQGLPPPLITPTTTVYSTGKQLSGPMFIRGSPYKTTHITTVWPHTTTVYPTGKQLSEPHVYQGFHL